MSWKGVFPDDLKPAGITPIFKKEDSLNKENYRLVSILPHLSKVFERILYKQIDSFHLTYAGLEKITMHSTRF